jgi:hypothetical protein
MAGGDVYRSGPPHIPGHHCFLSTEIDQGYRRHGRSHHRSRMLIHLVRHAVPSTLLQVSKSHYTDVQENYTRNKLVY